MIWSIQGFVIISAESEPHLDIAIGVKNIGVCASLTLVLITRTVMGAAEDTYMI